MAQPPFYSPTTDFSQQEANNASGRSTVNTSALDADQVPPQLQQKIEQMQMALKQLQEQNAQLQAAVSDKTQTMNLERDKLMFEKANAGEQIATQRESTQAQIAGRLEEARIRSQAAAAAEVEKARIQAELERERIASNERMLLAKQLSGVEAQPVV